MQCCLQLQCCTVCSVVEKLQHYDVVCNAVEKLQHCWREGAMDCPVCSAVERLQHCWREGAVYCSSDLLESDFSSIKKKGSLLCGSNDDEKTTSFAALALGLSQRVQC